MPETGKLIGQVFAGRYRIDELIGRGGMGHVFRALHTTMNKVVALKVLSSQMAVDPENVQRFEREAAAASELRHPNTIHMFDFGTSDQGELYLAMEFLNGRTLAKCLAEDGPFSPARACRVFRQLMESLEEAHSRGIIHRDLKPENVFITDIHRSEDFVKVLDFGIAKFKRTDQIKQTLTRTGFVCGTPQYLAPEQGLGTNVSPATDLYSAGVVLYELLTGTPPFTGDDPVSLVMKHIHEAPPPLAQEVRGNLPDDLANLLRQLLEKDPSRRPVSAAEVVERLDALGELSEVAPPRPDLMHSDYDAGPTLVGRSPPTDDQSPSYGVPTLPATPLSGTALGPTLRITAPPNFESQRRSLWRVAAPLLVVLVAVATGLGLWRPWEGATVGTQLSESEPAPGTGVGSLPAVGNRGVDAPPSVTPPPDLRPVPAAVAVAVPVPVPVTVTVTDVPVHGPVHVTDLQAPATNPAPDVAAPAPDSDHQPPINSPELTQTLRITSTPPGALVRIDGALLGATPIGILVDDGTEPVRVQVSQEGYEPQEWIYVPKEIRGRVAEKEFVLAPTSAVKPQGTTRPPVGGSPFGDLW
ncbi:MAG: serine/threonine-protein kinase [Pseudomonadota bacterium]